MQGIQLFEYKSLLESLNKVRDAHTLTPDEAPTQLVTEQEAKLKEIYAEYRQAKELLANCIRQFEEHKLKVRRFVKNHKLPAKRQFNSGAGALPSGQYIVNIQNNAAGQQTVV